MYAAPTCGLCSAAAVTLALELLTVHADIAISCARFPPCLHSIHTSNLKVVLVQEYFLMALSQPRSQASRASKHMRVASVTPANRAANVTAGMQPRNLDLLHKAHEKEHAERGEQPGKAPPPKGVLRTIKPIASGVAVVGPRMVKFRSNIQYLGEKVSVMFLWWQCSASVTHPQSTSLCAVHLVHSSLCASWFVGKCMSCVKGLCRSYCQKLP